MSLADSDALYMSRVLELAAQGEATTHPNPMVGCVIVADQQVVAGGFHKQAGEPHAERNALAQAGELARGATAYINLEPCCHQGRTPPCTDALIDSGVSRVVAAMADPNPLVAGGGFELLTAAGIEVISGVMESQARWLNRGFVTRMTTGKPWVSLKSAATLDGRTAAFNGESKWITGDAARAEVQHLRAKASAVITGIGTVLADDPSMNVRLDGTERQPTRFIIDANLNLPLDAKVIGNDSNCVVVTSHQTAEQHTEKLIALDDLGVEVLRIDNLPDSTRLDLNRLLLELGEWQFNHVMVEAGATLAGGFIEADLVDELALFYAGSIMGDEGKAMFDFGSPISFQERREFTVRDVKMVDRDVFVSAFSRQKLNEFDVD